MHRRLKLAALYRTIKREEHWEKQWTGDGWTWKVVPLMSANGDQISYNGEISEMFDEGFSF